MKKAWTLILFCTSLATVSLQASAAELKVAASDTVESVLAAQKGKKVTVRLRSGQDTTGTVTMVTPRVVQLAAIAGKEFFDAVVPLEAIEAVYVRTKD
jgi:hypothetical protein